MTVGTLQCDVKELEDGLSTKIVVDFKEDLKSYPNYDKLKAAIENVEGVEIVRNVSRYAVSVWRGRLFDPQKMAEDIALVVSYTLGIDIF